MKRTGIREAKVRRSKRASLVVQHKTKATVKCHAQPVVRIQVAIGKTFDRRDLCRRRWVYDVANTIGDCCDGEVELIG